MPITNPPATDHSTPLSQIRKDHSRIRAEATRLAGRPQNLVQRAQVYLQIYRHSGGRHSFPLLAAHGALWGAGHFRRGQKLARLLSVGQRDRHANLARLETFAHAFKDINRRVCIETYTTYHMTALHGPSASVRVGIDPALANALERCHVARKTGRPFCEAQKRDLFEAFFLWEQDNVVHPAVIAARSELQWPMMEPITMRPPIRFSYFPKLTRLWFRQFGDKDERIEKGKTAFEIANARGWDHVERAVAAYRILPQPAIRTPGAAYEAMLEKMGIAPRTKPC